MRHYYDFLNYFMVAVTILFLGLCINLILSRKYVSMTRYTYINQKIKHGFKVVQLTDLHNYEFGARNCRLIKKVIKENPDIIFLTGDILDKNEKGKDMVIDIIEQLIKVSPIYVSLGNHEWEYMKCVENRGFIAEIEMAGAVVLDKKYIDIVVNGQEIRLGGVYGEVLPPSDNKEDSEKQFLYGFQNTDRFKILLSHMPEGLLFWGGMEYWNIDLVFSGHMHGGQIRIPFVGGLYDPWTGCFPTHTKGMLKCGNGTIILSAGLGSSKKMPRINNLPELVTCEIIGQR